MTGLMYDDSHPIDRTALDCHYSKLGTIADVYVDTATGRPEWLASALRKLESAAHQIPNEAAERNPATAHMFIVNPLSGQRMDNLFSTHPSTENRVAALMELAQQMGQGGFHDGGVSRRQAPSTPAYGPWGGGSRRGGPWG